MAPPRSLLILDAANIVGSRPDGWWRDRPAALRRLLSALPGSLAPQADIIVVVEGAARPGIPDELPDGLGVVSAPASGDDQIVDVVRAALTRKPTPTITVVTSDRALRARVQALGADTVGPRWLWDKLAAAGP